MRTKEKKCNYSKYGKRGFDMAFAIPALAALFPLLASIAVLVRAKLGSPVLFRQERPGQGGRPFTIFKFRTMTEAKDADGNLLPDAERLPGFGKFLRAASLDELPELWNVLKGEMSIVGPRPLLMQYIERYTPEQARRHEVKPGLTGWAQVNGRNALSWEEKFKLDLWYVNNRSVALDLKIIGMTIRKVLKREGISAEGAATMSEFMGSEMSHKKAHKSQKASFGD